MTKNEIYNTYVEEMETSGVKPISLPMFSRMWQKKFRNAIIPKVYVHLNLLVKYCVDFKSTHLEYIIFFLPFHGIVVVVSGKQIHKMWRLCCVKIVPARNH